MQERDRPGQDLVSGLLEPTLWSTDPHPLLAELRAQAPMAWHADKGFWAVSRHADVMSIERDAATFCASRGILVDEIGVAYPSPPTILHCDPPEHTRYRRLVQPGFRPGVVADLEPSVRGLTRALVENLPVGEPCDILPALAVPLPVQVIATLLGVEPAVYDKVHAWSEAVIPGATDWPDNVRQALQEEMVTYLLRASRERRQQPGNDIISHLARVEPEADQLGDEELSMFLVQLLVAGNETTRNLLTGALVAFAEHPEQWSLVRRERRLVSGAVEEMLRWTTPVTAFMRTARRDAEVGGQSVSEGDPLLMLFVSANRDEDVFGPSAASFEVERHPNPHVAFGFGNHFCLGAALARLEARLALEELLERFVRIEPSGAVERSGSSVIAGIRRAELTFVPG